MFLKKTIYHILHYFIRSLQPTKLNNRIKKKILQLMGAKIGNNVSIDLGVIIYSPKYLVIGNDVTISSYSVITAGGGLEIKDNVMIGYGCKILSQNHKIPKDKKELIRNSGHELKKVYIKEGAWLASNVIVLPGVTIGEGAVIGAGSVVTKNVSSYTINVGVPCKTINNR